MPFHLILAAAAVLMLASAAQAQGLREGRSVAEQFEFAPVPATSARDQLVAPAARPADHGNFGSFSASQTARNLGY